MLYYWPRRFAFTCPFALTFHHTKTRTKRPRRLLMAAANKQFKMKDKGANELKKIEEAKAPGTLFTAAPATTANEAFRRVNEDPLLRMRCVCAGSRSGKSAPITENIASP